MNEDTSFITKTDGPDSSESRPIRQSSLDAGLSALKRAGPMVLVLALMGCFAFAGHRSGWTVPKFADLFEPSSPAKDDWCDKHSVPESICVECNASLMPKVETTYVTTCSSGKDSIPSAWNCAMLFT